MFSFFLEVGVNSKFFLLKNEKKSPNFPNHKIGGKTYGMWGNKKRYIHTYIVNKKVFMDEEGT